MWVCLTDNQDTGIRRFWRWSQSSSSLRPSFVSGIILGGIEKEAATHAKAIIKRRLSLGLVPPPLFPAVANCNIHHRGATFSADVSTTPRRIVPRQEIRPAMIPSPNASTVAQLFQLFTSDQVAARRHVVFRASATLDPRSFFTKREMKTRDRADSKRLTRIVLTWFYFPFEEDRERIVKKDR